jgi:hypothetical protein
LLTDLSNATTPKTALNFPTILDQVTSHGLAHVIAELIAVLSRGLQAFNVKQPMTPAQIEMFAEDFLDVYAYESIADLKVCLKHARLGYYGSHYQSIDSLTLQSWFKKYLDEKAEARELRHQELKTQDINGLQYATPEQLNEIKSRLNEK